MVQKPNGAHAVAVEHAAQALSSANSSFGRTNLRIGIENLRGERLVISFAMIILEVFVDGALQVGLTNDNHPICDFPFERTLEALDVGIAVG